MDQESEPQNHTSKSEYSEEESNSESNLESNPKHLVEELELFLQLEPLTPLSPIPRTRNPFLMSHQQLSTSTVASTTTTAAPPEPQELKLGQPSTFDGEPKKARAWINNTQLYLLVNKDVYDHDDKKIVFALSFMKEGSARLWALTETETALTRNPPGFGTWADFLKRFNNSFILENTREQAIAWLSTTKVNDKINLLDYISKFKNNATLSGITDQNVLINFFSRGIPTQLMRRIYSMDTVPTTMEKWYLQTLHFKHVWERTNEIAKGRNNPFLPFQDNRSNHNNTQKRETQTPWMWMPSKSKNSPWKKDKDVLTTTFASNVANPDIDPPNAETPSWENGNNRPPPLPRSKKSLTMKNRPPLEEFPQWIFKRGNLPDARDP